MFYLLKMHAEQIHSPFYPENKMVCGWKNGFSPSTCAATLWIEVCGAQKSYCCCRKVLVWCPLSVIPSFSHSSTSGLQLCCHSSACTLLLFRRSTFVRVNQDIWRKGKGRWDVYEFSVTHTRKFLIWRMDNRMPSYQKARTTQEIQLLS